jgi:hypothetical protein
MWAAIVLIIVAIIVAVWASKQGPPKTDTPKAEVPEVLDGRKIRRIYGTVWIDDPIVLAFKQVGTIPIKAKGK